MKDVRPHQMRPGWIYRMDVIAQQDCDAYPEELQEPFDRSMQGEFVGWTDRGSLAEFTDVDLTGEIFDEDTHRCVLLHVAWWEELHLHEQVLDDNYRLQEVRPARWHLTEDR